MRFLLTGLIVAGAALIAPPYAYADESVAGYWVADLGDDVSIDMNVTADGQWNSETAQGNHTVAEMAGKYTQHSTTATTGRLIFIPSQSHVTAAHGAAKIEYDAYVLSDDGQSLELKSTGDTLEFHKLIN